MIIKIAAAKPAGPLSLCLPPFHFAILVFPMKDFHTKFVFFITSSIVIV